MSCEYSPSLWVDLGDYIREDDMNCEYCGCLLSDEWHPNCKQCGGPRKAAREDTPGAGIIEGIDGSVLLEGFDGTWVRLMSGVLGTPATSISWTPQAVDNSLVAAWKRIKGARE